MLPLYVLDDETPGAWAIGGAGRWWLHHSLSRLGDDLAARGAPLVLRRGRWSEVVPSVAAECGADLVFAGRPIEPWARTAMDGLARTFGDRLRLFETTTIFEPGSVRTQSGGAYGVFTPFAKACLARGRPAAPLAAPAHLAGASVPGDALGDWALLPTAPDWAGGMRATWTPGETGASARLRRFAEAVAHDYARTRNLPGTEGTSSISPYLHFGEISAGQAWHTVEAAARDATAEGVRAFHNELLWREFSANLLWTHPTLPERELRPEFAAMPWTRQDRALRAWQRGRTGIPIVDAGLRQLWAIGWMHNRVRMITASFLVKHLLIPWQDGEAWFWDTLVDADLASNAAQWQWVAGCGADAAPFFRIFNPVLQGRKFDPEGAYVRRWVPELARLSDKAIHAPWEIDEGVLAHAGVTLGRTYPRPVVDLAAGRDRALAAFRSLGRKAA